MSALIAPTPPAYPSPGRRALITGSVMLSTMIVALDATIANVALPHMQASLGASPEQVVWVLTSYLIASAIMTPLASWLASRFGRQKVMTISAAGFTLASLACGLAGSLEFMVVARIVQGLCGAGLIPLGQATLMDINPPERQGKAMAMAGLGAMLGPLTGPTLGGWLTDNFTWRWVFLINLPVGILALIGIATFLPEVRDKVLRRFDMLGFATVSVFLGSFQLLLDRGEQLDWFDSAEIWIYAALFIGAGYQAVVHMLTARNTFVRAELFADRNYVFGCAISTVVGVVVFATVPIITIMMQTLLGYTPLHAGVVGMPRGIGTVLGLLIVGRMMGRIDARVLLFIGLSMLSVSLWMFAGMTLQMDERQLLIANFLQGMAGGLLIAPLSALTLTTLPPHFRNEGSAIYALARNMGSSLGISALQVLSTRNNASVSGQLSENVRPDNPQFGGALPDFNFHSLPDLAGMAGQIARQAAMVATVDTMWLTCLLSLATLPIALMMRTKGSPVGGPQRTAALDAH